MKRVENLINRKDIYAGKLAKYNNNVTKTFIADDGQKLVVKTDRWEPCRTVLFTIDKQEIAHDLLYKKESSISEIKPYYSTSRYNNGEYAVFYTIAMDKLLEYFGYPEQLTSDDLKRISEYFFSPRFFKKHCDLFGYTELSAQDLIDMKAVDIASEEERNAFEVQYQKMQDKGFERYGITSIEETELPFEYFSRLRLLSGLPTWEGKHFNKPKKDVFKPSLLKEGPVKKLIKR